MSDPMVPKIELLAPGGDVEAIKAAIIAGADAVYCGLDTFNARNRATNISFDQLVGVIRLAHQYQCEIFLTLNVVILERGLRKIGVKRSTIPPAMRRRIAAWLPCHRLRQERNPNRLAKGRNHRRRVLKEIVAVNHRRRRPI